MTDFWGMSVVIASGAMVFTAAYKWSSIVRYYVKVVAYVSIIFFAPIPITFLSLWNAGDVENHWYLRLVCCWALDYLYKVKVVVHDSHLLESKKPFVLVINHQSAFDVFVLSKFWPKRSACLAKKELKYFGFFGLSLQLCGTVFIDRSNRQKAILTMDRAVTRVQRDKICIVVFPEGTRNSDGNLLPFKKGAFHLAIQAQVPVVPAVISSYEPFFSDKSRTFEPGTVLVKVLPPVQTSGLTSEDAGDLAESVRSLMVPVWQSLKAEGKAANQIVEDSDSSSRPPPLRGGQGSGDADNDTISKPLGDTMADNPQLKETVDNQRMSHRSKTD